MLQTLTTIVGPRPALATTAAVYVLIVGFGSVTTEIEGAMLFLLGMLLSVMYQRTRALWLPAAAQFGWLLVAGQGLGFTAWSLPEHDGVSSHIRHYVWLSEGLDSPSNGLDMIFVLACSLTLFAWLSPRRWTAPLE